MRKHAVQLSKRKNCACIHRNSPRLHAALQRLQAGLDQVQRLEQQSGAGPAERATHERFDGWVSLRCEGRKLKHCHDCLN